MNFPLFNTKELSDGKKYDLNDPAERREYFQAKLGTKIDDIKEYLDNNTFVAFLLAKKSAGKGTYSKMFGEIIGTERIAHISVGDLVRDAYVNINDPKYKEEVIDYMKKHYRGFMSIEDALDALTNKSQEKLLPTEFILTLVKKEIEKVGRKALFLDGLPRNLDQISYSLYFRDLINFRDDRDMFMLIDVPEAVIDERMKYRVICPDCHTSRNVKLLPTKFVKYDNASSEFYLVCDNAECTGYEKTRMVRKEGDEKGTAPIKARLETDGKLMEMATTLQGIPKILLRNAIPADKAADLVDEYELTPEFVYSLDEQGNVKVTEKPWVIKDDHGVDSHSLMAPAVVVSLISQLHKVLLND
jgi:adenylate kinase family enzyme